MLFAGALLLSSAAFGANIKASLVLLKDCGQLLYVIYIGPTAVRVIPSTMIYGNDVVREWLYTIIEMGNLEYKELNMEEEFGHSCA